MGKVLLGRWSQQAVPKPAAPRHIIKRLELIRRGYDLQENALVLSRINLHCLSAIFVRFDDLRIAEVFL
jgi:hypothetical protein